MVNKNLGRGRRETFIKVKPYYSIKIVGQYPYRTSEGKEQERKNKLSGVAEGQ